MPYYMFAKVSGLAFPSDQPDLFLKFEGHVESALGRTCVSIEW